MIVVLLFEMFFIPTTQTLQFIIIQFKQHVELKGVEPFTSCMPYKRSAK